MNIVNVGYDSTNYYVLEQNRKRLLIDVGFPGTLPKLRASLKRAGITLQGIPYFCVTHFHPDHAGLVQELKAEGVKHLIFQEQLAAVPQMKVYVKPDSSYVEIRLHDSLQLTTAESRAWLAAKLSFAGEVVSTPGHSDDSVSLVLDEGIAFTGDLTPPDSSAEGQAEVIRQSWDKLRALKVLRIYPGHGPIRPLP
ncbi:MAG: MBL fold metallo-hydrolase [Caldilineaceae bacterium]